MSEGDWDLDYKVGYFTGSLEKAIDGEGNICLSRCKDRKYLRGYRYVPIVAIANTSEEWVEHIREFVGEGKIAYRKLRGGNRKDCYIYYMTRGAMRDILPNLQLIVKEKQKQLLLEALSIIKSYDKRQHLDDAWNRLDEIYDEMKKLNKRGVD